MTTMQHLIPTRTLVPLALVALGMIIASCVAPSDIDTARDRIVEDSLIDDPVLPINPWVRATATFKIRDMSLGTVQEVEYTMAQGGIVWIDTTVDTPTIRIRASFVPPPSASATIYPLRRFRLIFDSIYATAGTMNFTGDPIYGSGADMTMDIGGEITYAAVSLTYVVWNPVTVASSRGFQGPITISFNPIGRPSNISGSLEIRY